MAEAPERTPFDDGELFDALFNDFDYGIAHYLDLARRANGPVLDVCCGTGRVLIPLLQAGIETEGVDLFAPMLERLSEKASALGLAPRLHQSDMRTFCLDRRFALIIIPFNSIVHNLTTEAQLETLGTCREHLLPGGLLAFDTFFPSLQVIAAPDGERVLELETRHPWRDVPMRVYDTRRFDRVQQVQHSIVEVEELDEAGNVVATDRSQTSIRWIYRSEMELLLRVAGFDRWEIYGDFEGGPLERETDQMIVHARRDA